MSASNVITFENDWTYVIDKNWEKKKEKGKEKGKRKRMLCHVFL